MLKLETKVFYVLTNDSHALFLTELYDGPMYLVRAQFPLGKTAFMNECVSLADELTKEKAEKTLEAIHSSHVSFLLESEGSDSSPLDPAPKLKVAKIVQTFSIFETDTE